MKVPASVRRIFEEQKLLNDRLKDVIDAKVAQIKHVRWHYESRVKSVQSVALKLETGRIQRPSDLEDFFACTLVVGNGSEIQMAEELVRAHFAVRERRPKAPELTHKSPDHFPFDDLRLYCTLAVDQALPPTDLDELLFEIQIKTFLQHAWAIATHDLVYKSDGVHWSKERIAYQTKAMLEHAEMAIQEAERLADSPSLAMEDRRTAGVRAGIELLKRQWASTDLPTDIRRVALNILRVIDALGLSLTELEGILDAAKREGSGAHPSNLSPYSTVIQCLLRARPDAMRRVLTDTRSRKPTRILIVEEVELPASFDRNALPNAIFVP